MKMINCLDEFKRECEIEAIETYINQECIDAIGRSVVKYGPKDGLIMAPTEIPFNVLLLNARLNDVYTESFKAYREYVKKYLVQLRKRSPNKGSFFFSYAHALSSFAHKTSPIMRKDTNLYLGGIIMAGYKVGTQVWYDVTRRRLVEISKELQKPELVQEMRDHLYLEQLYLADELLRYADDGLVRNPIE